MKVAVFHVTATFVTGGSESYAWELARFLQRRGHQCDLWGGKVPDPRILAPEVQLKTAPFTPRERALPIGSRFQKLWERVTFAFHARREFLAQPCDILNIHKPYDIPAALWFRRRTGCRIVWRCHGTDFYPGLKRLLPRIDSIYCVSAFAQRTLMERFPVQARVIHTGVDTVFFDPGEIPSQAANPEPRILYFGRLEGWKGVQVLIEALARLKATRWQAEIIGDGPEQGALSARILSLGLASRVRLEPAVRDRFVVRRRIAMADIVVFPAVGVETFSNALLEAMSMRKAAVATQVGGFMEIIENGNNGRLAPPRDPAALAAVIDELLRNTGLRLNLGARARRTVTDHFSSQASFEKVEQLFANVMRR